MTYCWLQVSFLHFLASLIAGYSNWNVLVTGPFYNDFKLTVPNNTLRSHYLPIGLIDPELKCVRICVHTQACVAVNFMTWAAYHVCELLSDNLCGSNPTVILHAQRSSRLWDKSLKNCKTCLGSNASTSVLVNDCEVIHPGCSGTWPNCSNCLQTCGSCITRYNYTSADKFNCTLWPGASNSSGVSVFSYCNGYNLIIMKRKVNIITGDIEDSYMMPFADMNRFIQRNFYNMLYFYFKNSNGYYIAQYRNPYISENGTLSNLTFFNSTFGDGLRLNNSQLSSAPFVRVNDDLYGCGSFWLFDQQNATYCPGGQVGLFGTPRLNSTGHVVDTGIHWPTTNPTLFFQAEVYLRYYNFMV